MMEPIPVQFTERANIDRHQEPVRFGVPLQQGQFGDTTRFQLNGQDGEPVRADFSPLLYWPDGSVRWVCVDALLSLKAASTTTLWLVQTPQSHPVSQRWRVSEDKQYLSIRTGPRPLQIDKTALTWCLTDEQGQQYQHTHVVCEDSTGAPCIARVEHWNVHHFGTLSTVLEAAGWWHDGAGAALARFRCELTVYATGQVSVEISIHNPGSQNHQGGDRGAAGSIRFGSLGLRVKQPGNDQARIALTPGGAAQTLDLAAPLILHQESSGGDQWDSRNHVGPGGRVLPRYRGFRLTKGEQQLDAGHRASPIAEVQSGAGTRVSASLPRFWQDFPSALHADRTGLSVWLFPQDKAEPYELLGGERKTQRAVIAYDQPLGSLRWTHSPLLPVVPADHYEKTGAFHWFRAVSPPTPLDDLIRNGLEGPASFLRKRETADEFGWRNFGDIAADGETLPEGDDETAFISRCHNRFDTIYGFARQFVRSGDPRWFDLMNDLARHVSDIDIYHTDEDHSEYNLGSFWHVVRGHGARTSVPRTSAPHQDTGARPGQPGDKSGMEHCYTTGLLYHYLLTGCGASREAVLELAGWMKAIHYEQGGLPEQILALKQHELPKLREKLRGGRPSPHRFPLTRETANYINTLIDDSMLEPRSNSLVLAGKVVRQTVHPADDIEGRHLLEPGNNLSYPDLLSSVVRFLGAKEEAGETDDDWRYARDSFLHYARWMYENEEPLQGDSAGTSLPDGIATAQNTRKAMLLYQAAAYLPAQAQSFRGKADDWLHRICGKLERNEARHLAVTLSILMRNYGPHQVQPEGPSEHPTPEVNAAYTAPSLGWGTLLAWITRRLLKGAVSVRPRKEKAWLNPGVD